MNVAEEVVAKTYEEQLEIVQRSKFKCAKTTLLVVPPVVEKVTKGGIIKPASLLSTEERQAGFNKFHKVLAIADNIDDIKVGDKIWISLDSPIHRIILEDVVAHVVQWHQIVGIIPADEVKGSSL